MYRKRQPDLNIESFATLADLADAAEKYQVFSAIPQCKKMLQYAVAFSQVNGLTMCHRQVSRQSADPQTALEILAYATRKEDLEMANSVVKYTVALSPKTVFQSLE